MLTQIFAARAALDQVGKTILDRHVEHCVHEAIADGKAEEAIRDLQKAIDRLI